MNHCELWRYLLTEDQLHILHKLPPKGQPDIEANVWLLLLSTTYCSSAWNGANVVFNKTAQFSVPLNLSHCLPFYCISCVSCLHSLSLIMLLLWFLFALILTSIRLFVPYPVFHLSLSVLYPCCCSAFPSHSFSLRLRLFIPPSPSWNPDLKIVLTIFPTQEGAGRNLREPEEFGCCLSVL